MAHHVVHWEIMGPDGEGLAEFYRGLFGWELPATPGFDGYHMASSEETGVGGAVGSGGDGPSQVTLYVEVDSIDDHLAQIGAAGGSTVVPRTVVPGMVVFAQFSDPAGNVVGLVERETPPAG